jgi:hypothetical protein
VGFATPSDRVVGEPAQRHGFGLKIGGRSADGSEFTLQGSN